MRAAQQKNENQIAAKPPNQHPYATITQIHTRTQEHAQLQIHIIQAAYPAFQKNLLASLSQPVSSGWMTIDSLVNGWPITIMCCLYGISYSFEIPKVRPILNPSLTGGPIGFKWNIGPTIVIS